MIEKHHHMQRSPKRQNKKTFTKRNLTDNFKCCKSANAILITFDDLIDNYIFENEVNYNCQFIS
jgi:hypothetical protein